MDAPASYADCYRVPAAGLRSAPKAADSNCLRTSSGMSLTAPDIRKVLLHYEKRGKLHVWII